MAQNMQEMMRAMQFALNVPKLNATNYIKWKRDMEIRLRSTGLWSLLIDEPPPPRVDNAYEQRNSLALQDIYASCEPDQQDLIMDFTKAKECWDFLHSKYENRSATNINRLWNEFDSFRMLDGEKMAKYISRMKTIVRELKGIGQDVPDARWISRLIAGLSRKYNILKATLRHRTSTADECITFLEEEETILLREEADDERSRPTTRPPDRSASPNGRLGAYRDRAYPATYNATGKRCYACGGTNHLVADCFHVHPDRRPPDYAPPGPGLFTVLTLDTVLVTLRRIKLLHGTTISILNAATMCKAHILPRASTTHRPPPHTRVVTTN